MFGVHFPKPHQEELHVRGNLLLENLARFRGLKPRAMHRAGAALAAAAGVDILLLIGIVGVDILLLIGIGGAGWKEVLDIEVGVALMLDRRP